MFCRVERSSTPAGPNRQSFALERVHEGKHVCAPGVTSPAMRGVAGPEPVRLYRVLLDTVSEFGGFTPGWPPLRNSVPVATARIEHNEGVARSRRGLDACNRDSLTPLYP